MENRKIKSFTDLNTWKEAHKLVLLVYKLTNKFPKTEQFGLTSQLKRAVISVSSNIAEGFSRRTKADKQHFYYHAISSLTETQNQLLVARDVGYINNSQFGEVASQSVATAKLIRALIKSALSR